MAEPHWHPLYAARELEPGVWVLTDAQDREYGRIEIRRVTAGVVRYRCAYRGELLGWSTTLRLACERVHRAFISSHGPVPFAGYPAMDGHIPKSREASAAHET
ncbi:hypothetical protein ACFM35_00900 [Microbacterium sp. P01]|uniref:hypothetical protein n=1 Tax=Microbacterium sp. P01 TaxID=3366261 RepID=UPI00366C996F